METLRFNELNLSPEILRGIKEMGFEEASPIQSKAIPIAMTGTDLIGQAQTGTGKTAAFGIPVLEKVKKEIKHPQTLILCPTRELAVQAAEEIRRLAKYLALIYDDGIRADHDTVGFPVTAKYILSLLCGQFHYDIHRSCPGDFFFY